MCRLHRIVSTGLVLLALTAVGGCEEENARPTESDVVYGEVGGQKLLLDVFLPGGQAASPAAGLRPAVIFLHGGGWQHGSKSEFHAMAAGAARLRMVGFAVDYRLVSGQRNRWPACFDDAQRAVRWVRAHAKQYAIDPQRIGGVGGSAGGHLVALLGTCDTRDNSDPALAAFSSRLTCGVDLSGPTDLTIEIKSPNAPLDPTPWFAN